VVERPSRALRHRPGLDGVRALAIVAVVAYHLDASWLPAGFLGVDVFFVVSGYLICSLLVAEWQRRGGIGVVSFWGRRARRLLPALFALLAAVAVLGPLLAPDATRALRADLLAAGFYVGNWWQIVHEQSYFEAIGRPPLLRHLWSLGVEEQFYIVFPLLFAVGMTVTRGHVRRLALVAAGIALASVVAMAVLWHPGDDPERVYYGTDTRAAGLCLGVALAFLWPSDRLRPRIAQRARQYVDFTGIAALTVLVVLMTTLTEQSALLYRGGFALTAIASMFLVAVAVHPASHVGRVLGGPWLHWLGTRSYAIYLWHWPVFMVTRPGVDIDASGVRVTVWRLLIVGVLAELSWRLVEQPFRTGTAQAAWRGAGPVVRRRLALSTAGFALVALAVVPAIFGEPAGPTDLLAGQSTETTLVSLDASASRSTATTAPPASRGSAAGSRSSTTTTTSVTTTTAPPQPTPATTNDGRVLAVGDSVLLAAQRAVVESFGARIGIDAAVGRQVDEGIALLERYRQAGTLAQASAVVVDLGTNGPMTAQHVERLGRALEGVPRVVIVNVRVPRRWEAESNASINDAMARNPQWKLADWYTASAGDGAMERDGVHPTTAGARIYADVVSALVNEPLPTAPSTTTTTTLLPPETSTTIPAQSTPANPPAA
jgi:peptidoglycan/LPS O-acetylase OafA/YrhL